MITTLKTFGLDVASPAIDGKIHRVKCNGSKERNGWYVAREHKGKTYCTFGDWATGETGKWPEGNGSTITAQDKAAWTEIAKIAEAEAKRLHIEAAKKAQAMIDGASPSDTKHLYLTKKGIKPHRVLQSNDLIITPMYLSDGTLTGYQSITPTGEKRYLYGMEKKGSAYIIDGKAPLCICEGFATGATIHDATGCKVLCAMDSGNLIHVARAAAKKNTDILICADNDHAKEAEGKGNAGIKAAKAIKEELGIDYVYPQGIEGTDFNDMAAELGIKAVRKLFEAYKKEGEEANWYKPEDIIDTPKTLQIEPELVIDQGLISLGVRAAQELSGVKIIQYTYPSIISTIATALAGKICCQHVHPSCFFVRVGSTSTGKTHTDKHLKAYLTPHFNEIVNRDGGTDVVNSFYGPTDFASGPGLIKAIQRQLRAVIILDEITFVFSKNNQKDTVAQGKVSALLELSTAAGSKIHKVYSDAGNDVKIEGAVVNLIGNATPLIFKAFTLDDLQSGLIQRFDFWAYDGPALYRDDLPDITGEAAKEFAERLAALRHVAKPEGRYSLVTDDAVDIGFDNEAKSLIKRYSNSIVDEVNSEESEGLKGIISRKYEAAIKYALIHAGATREVKDIFNPLEKQDIDYGIVIANKLCEWKLRVLVGNISAGEFDTLCRHFVDAALAAVKSGRKPTLSYMRTRRRQLDNIPPRQMDEIIRVVRARRLIQIIDEPGQPTVYQPLKTSGG